jgi:D-lactate dehydrogenase (cytochrome)/glycolate oxidase
VCLGDRNVLFLGVDVNAGAEERLFRGLALSSAATSHRWQEVMKLLESMRRLFYSQIARPGEAAASSQSRTWLSTSRSSPGGDGELKALVAVTLATATSARPRDTVERKDFLETMADVIKLNGTMSAEHGIGLLKKDLLVLEVDGLNRSSTPTTSSAPGRSCRVDQYGSSYCHKCRGYCRV